MEISNRKLFSHGVVVIGLAVAAAGVFEAAAEEPKASAAAQKAVVDGETGLSQKERAARQARFAAQDEKLTAARKLYAEQKYDEATKVFEAILVDLEKDRGLIADERRAVFRRELAKIRREWANSVMFRARLAAVEKRYADAISIATDVQNIDAGSKEEAAKLIEYCTQMQKGEEAKTAVSLDKANPDLAHNRKTIDRLLREAEVFYRQKRLEEARSRAERVFLIDPYNVRAVDLMSRIYRQIYSYGLHRHEADTMGMVAYSDWQWAEPVFTVSVDSTVRPGTERPVDTDGIYARMERIIFPSIAFDDADIMAVIRFLNSRSKVFDPDKQGVNISTGINARTAETLKRITMSFSRIPMSEVLRYICQDTGLKYRIEHDGVFIGPEVDEMQTRYFPIRGNLISGIIGESGGSAGGDDGLGGRMEAPAPARGGGGKEDTIEAKTFLETAESGGAAGVGQRGDAQALFPLRGVTFSEGTSIDYDKRTGRLIVRNTLENLQRLDELIRQLDAIEKPLIMIEIKAIEVTEQDMQELGFHWSMDMIGKNMNNGELNRGAKQGWNFGQGQNMTSVTRPGSDVTGVDGTVIDSWNIFPALFGSQHPFGSDIPLNILLTISALSQNSRTETMAAPKVMTSNGTTAEVRLAKSYQFPTDWETYEIEEDDGTYTITPPAPSFDEEEDVGVIFDVTPRVNSDNYTINLKVNPQISQYLGKDSYQIQVSGYTRQLTTVRETIEGNLVVRQEWVNTPQNIIFDVWMPMISRRNLSVNVNVYDGETVVLGGMVDNTTISRVDKWPILGDLPLVGRFFQSHVEDVVRKSLLVFVTARLVNNDGIPIRRNKNVGAPDFNR
ncbi:MAG: hypothetical protein L6W00_06600 [Lentisphaeria bacterium]|nr:MAG: hypothetical protein L6W00_06600 [Lentisphaeria bacterium]